MTSISAAPPPPPPPQNVQSSAAVQRETAVREGDRLQQQALDPAQDAASVSVTPEARELAAQQTQPVQEPRQEVQTQSQVPQTAPSNQQSTTNLRQQLIG
jgi:hypothetical protein